MKFSCQLLVIRIFIVGLPLFGFTQELAYENPEAVGFSSERLQRLDAAFSTYAENKDLPGGVILIGRRDKVIYHKAFGYSDVESKTPMQTNALFRIASQTKAIVSTGILLLQEQGKLNISDPLSRFIPEFE